MLASFPYILEFFSEHFVKRSTFQGVAFGRLHGSQGVLLLLLHVTVMALFAAALQDLLPSWMSRERRIARS